MSIPAFQGVESATPAFGIAFQGRTRRPYIFTTLSREAIEIEVISPVRNIAPGAAVYIQVNIRDANQTTKVLFNPDTSMQITLINPAGTEVVTLGSMTNEATGQYGYNYQSSTSSPVGCWTAKFKAVNGSATGWTHPIGVFVIRAE